MFATTISLYSHIIPGRVDPIPFELKNDFTGVGQISQDVRVAEATVSQRRGLDSERQTKESEDQRRVREVGHVLLHFLSFLTCHLKDDAARRSAIATEVSDTLKAFYCSLCDKQFKNVAQYDEHTNSYAHHHKARFRDMQNNVRIKPVDEVEKRKEKERKREEKELRKIAAANGIRMAKSTTVAALAPVTEGSSSIPPLPTSSSSGFKKPGWAAVSVSAPPPPPPAQPTLPTVPTSLTDPLQPPPAVAPPLAPAPPFALNPVNPEPRPSKAQASRSGWQKFQKSNSRRN